MNDEQTWDTADVKTCPHGYVFVRMCLDCKGWVPVKNSLPQNKQIVLVIDKHGEMAVCEAKVDYQYFFILLNTSLQIRDVTHWMDLPEPPNK